MSKENTIKNVFTDDTTKQPFLDDLSGSDKVDVNSLLSRGNVSVSSFDYDEDFEMTGSSLLLHHNVESVTPESLIDMLSIITKTTPDVISGPKGAVVCVNTPHGKMIFTNQDTQASWRGAEPEQSLMVGLVYKFSLSSYIAPKIQSELNRSLLTGRVVVNRDNELEYRTSLSFRGGRTVENVLWDIVVFSNEALTIKMALL